jgi:hypothetical protein
MHLTTVITATMHQRHKQAVQTSAVGVQQRYSADAGIDDDIDDSDSDTVSTQQLLVDSLFAQRNNTSRSS